LGEAFGGDLSLRTEVRAESSDDTLAFPGEEGLDASRTREVFSGAQAKSELSSSSSAHRKSPNLGLYSGKLLVEAVASFRAPAT